MAGSQLCTAGHDCLVLGIIVYCWAQLSTAGHNCLLLSTIVYCWAQLSTGGTALSISVPDPASTACLDCWLQDMDRLAEVVCVGSPR